MLGVKEAVAAAEVFARGLFSEAELTGLRVEEIESSTAENKWMITLGWPEASVRSLTGSGLGISHGGVFAVPRGYKQFIIDAESGAMLSMKDRSL